MLSGLAFLMLSFYLTTGLAAKEAADNPPESKQSQDEMYSEKVKELMHFLEGKSDTFLYRRIGRSDPFMPFVKEKVVTSELEAEEEELVGMRKFEPGQLTLVAIVFAGNSPLAMVQDSVGKGYMIKTGTEIGRAGVVEKISANLVTIKQRYRSSAGDERYKIVEMLLNKEGEQ